MGRTETFEITVSYDDEGRVKISGDQTSKEHKGLNLEANCVEVVHPLFGLCPPMDPNEPLRCPPMKVTAELGWTKQLELELTKIEFDVGGTEADPPGRRPTDRPPKPQPERHSES